MGSPPATTPSTTTPDAGEQKTPPSRGLAFDAEHGLTGNRYIQFATHNLPPPAELYVVADDGLLVTVTANQAGLTVLISAQLLLPDGRLSSNQFQATAPGTSTPTQFLFPLTEGYLFNVTVQPATGVRRGACWVSVAIRRGGLVSGVTLQTLIQDYVDSFSGPTWPGGLIRATTEGTGLLLNQYTTGIGANTAFTFNIPANTRVRLRSICETIVTSAVAGNRNGKLILNDPAGQTMYAEDSDATQAASSTGVYSWAVGVGWGQTTAPFGVNVRSLPDIALPSGAQVWVYIAAPQTGDVVQSVNMSWEQWFSA